VAVLQRKHIDGTVEVQSVQQYNSQVVTLASKVRQEAPRRFGQVDVLWEIVHGALVCPVAHIEVGVRGHVPEGLIDWAEAAEHRYGSDRLRWKYYAEGEVF
jgi:hypothetical protein